MNTTTATHSVKIMSTKATNRVHAGFTNLHNGTETLCKPGRTLAISTDEPVNCPRCLKALAAQASE